MSIGVRSYGSTLNGRAPAWRVAARTVARRLRAIAASLARRKEIENLARLDERMLADMGLTRGDLDAASRWSLWGDPGDRLSKITEERRAARRSL